MRFPYYLTGLVKSFATGVSEVSVGAHEFKAWICYDGRAVVPKAPPEIGQWEICIGGKKVPALTKEDLARVQAKQEGTWESRFNARVQAQQQNTIRKDQLTDGQHAAMHKYLWAAEIEHIEQCQTFRFVICF